MSANLNIGDVVMLKSGGPKMTIDALESDLKEDHIVCTYFEGNNMKKVHVHENTVVKIQ